MIDPNPLGLAPSTYSATERERAWLGTGSVATMLEILGGERLLTAPRAERKLRLYLCGVIRLAAANWTDTRIGTACVAAEEYADGCIDEGRLQEGYWLAHAATLDHHEGLGPNAGAAALASIACQRPFPALESVATVLPFWAQTAGVVPHDQAGLLRDVFGNPFRVGTALMLAGGCLPAPFGVPLGELLPWQHALSPATVEMAMEIYHFRSWQRLPAFADVLPVKLDLTKIDSSREWVASLHVGVEAVQHCRGRARCPECLGDGVNAATSVTCNSCGGGCWVRNSVLRARGCWVLDLVLGH